MINIEDKFKELMQNAGYNSYPAFAEAVGIDYNNIRRNVRQEKHNKVQLDRLFKYANTLHVPIAELLWLFYSSEMEENQKSLELYMRETDRIGNGGTK